MRGYEEGKPIYFATPPVQLVCSLHASLKEITARPIEERWQKHQQASQDFKKFITDELGLKLVRAIPFEILNKRNQSSSSVGPQRFIDRCQWHDCDLFS